MSIKNVKKTHTFLLENCLKYKAKQLEKGCWYYKKPLLNFTF